MKQRRHDVGGILNMTKVQVKMQKSEYSYAKVICGQCSRSIITGMQFHSQQFASSAIFGILPLCCSSV